MLIYHQKVDTRKKILEKKTPRMGIIVHGQVKHVLTAGTGISWESRECLKITESKKSLWLLSFEHVTPNQTITPGNQNYPMYFHIKLFKSTSNLGCFARLSAVLQKRVLEGLRHTPRSKSYWRRFWHAGYPFQVYNLFSMQTHTRDRDIFHVLSRFLFIANTDTLLFFF